MDKKCKVCGKNENEVDFRYGSRTCKICSNEISRQRYHDNLKKQEDDNLNRTKKSSKKFKFDIYSEFIEDHIKSTEDEDDTLTIVYLYPKFRKWCEKTTNAIVPDENIFKENIMSKKYLGKQASGRFWRGIIYVR